MINQTEIDQLRALYADVNVPAIRSRNQVLSLLDELDLAQKRIGQLNGELHLANQRNLELDLLERSTRARAQELEAQLEALDERVQELEQEIAQPEGRGGEGRPA
jgi:chromosome segregation ATPase